jgi:ATP-dependent exoDNAse (exonuclease V) beta subunit
LPASFIAQCTASGSVQWRASSGASHQLRVCRDDGVHASSSATPTRPVGVVTDFAPLSGGGSARRSVAATIAGNEPFESSADGGGDSDRLVGTLVHRLIQRLGCDASVETARECASQLIRAEELFECEPRLDADGTLDAAVTAYQALAHRDDVRSLYESSHALHEIPFTMKVEDTWLRGSIDCLLYDESGVLTVLEFKTGRPRREHDGQIELYRRAAERLFPQHRVEARLVYAAAATV